MNLLNFVKITSVMLCLSASADPVSRKANETDCSVDNTVYSINGLTIPAPQDMVRIADSGLFEEFSATESVPEQEILAAFVLKSQFEKADVFKDMTHYASVSVFDDLKTINLSDNHFKACCEEWGRNYAQYKNGLDVTESSLANEIRQAIRSGKISKDDYKVVLTGLKQNSDENGYGILLKRTETLKVKGVPEVKCDLLLSFVFMKVGTHCLITKLCHLVEDGKDLNAELQKVTEIHNDWVTNIRNSNKSVDGINQYGKTAIYVIYALTVLFALLVGRKRNRSSKSTSAGGIVDTDPPKGPVGIWGWNTIPLLNLAGIVIMTVIQFFKLYLPLIENGAMQNCISGWGNGILNQQEALCVFLESVGTILIAVFAIRVIELAFARRRLYPKACTWLFVMNALLSIIGLVFAVHLGYSAEGGDVKTAVRVLMFAIIWGMYFAKSERIKNTFTR